MNCCMNIVVCIILYSIYIFPTDFMFHLKQLFSYKKHISEYFQCKSDIFACILHANNRIYAEFFTFIIYLSYLQSNNNSALLFLSFMSINSMDDNPLPKIHNLGKNLPPLDKNYLS